MDTLLRKLERQAATGDYEAKDRLVIYQCKIEGHLWGEWFTVYVHPTRRCQRCFAVWQRKNCMGNQIYTLPAEQLAWRAFLDGYIIY